MTAAVPGGIQLIQISSQRTHPGTEDVRPSAADDISNNLPTVSCSTNDFSDRDARRDKTADRGCDLVPSKKPIVLPSLRITQERPIDLSPTDGASDQWQRLACRIEEGRTGIFHEVPSIGHLHGVRAALIGRLPVGGAAITCDHPDRWPVREPRRYSRRFAVRQNVAAWLGWTLDAFDFTVFLLIMHPIAQTFDVSMTAVTFVFTITLWMRLIGATTSGWFGDRLARNSHTIGSSHRNCAVLRW